MGREVSRKYYGFSLAEMAIIVAILGVILIFAIPSLIGMRAEYHKNSCINNLREIHYAKERWGLDNDMETGDTPTAENLDPYIKDDIWDEANGVFATGHNLVCPEDGDSTPTINTSYVINAIGTNPECAISETHILE